MKTLARALIFLGASVVSGLALAFLLVAWHPELIRRAAPAPPATRDSNAVREGATATAASSDANEPRTTPAESSPPARAPGESVRRIKGPVRVTYADAVERAAPAVVNIFTARQVTERIAPPFGELFGDTLLPQYRSRIERSLGSGVIIDQQGHIVTNQHVIANAQEIRVQLADGRTATASVVGRDPDTDLAVLKIKLPHLPVMPLGRSDQLKVGDVVLAIGDALGLSQTVTHGIVSATSRQQLGIATLEDFIQTDAPINFGNSGGALIDTNGELVGINTAIVAKSLGVEGIGFAIPVNMVRGVVRELIAKGRVVRGWIGILPEDVTNDQAVQLGLARGGVVVVRLYLGSPAVQAGLRSGDLLTEVDGSRVESAQELMAHIVERTPGSVVRVHGLRGLSPFTASVRVAEEPVRR
ncbi:MAG TPA: trypsin-like peptidase domain-containing protein [Steroidobacteraceae bacterium]|nr:trypsin-like peptidase domain-containing protein [Steroidobacteraceae bacterium]